MEQNTTCYRLEGDSWEREEFIRNLQEHVNQVLQLLCRVYKTARNVKLIKYYGLYYMDICARWIGRMG
jgi:hypothetical protein